jgi:DNA-binding transcriptional regulator PaaX
MALVEEILKELWNTSLYSKGGRVNLFGIPRFKNRSFGSMRTTIYRLHKNNLIKKQDTSWHLTPAGRKYAHKKLNSLQEFFSSNNKNDNRNLIVMFDVPEPKKAEREWLRWHLKKFNFIMIQKSVWVGPSPLPKEFLDYIKKIGLRESIKTFKLAKSYQR